MKNISACVVALLLAACHDEPAMTFGLEFRFLDPDMPDGPATTSCVPPGSHGGETSGVGSWPTGAPPPHLFLEAEPDAEENVFHVRVFVASERDEDGIWWVPSEVLAERTYDGAFGEGGGEDSIVVDFEGRPQTIEVLGLPPEAPCP